MDLAWHTYVQAYGYPDILQLHFATWEAAMLIHHEASTANLVPGTSFIKRSVHDFENNMRGRIRQGLALIAENNNAQTRLTLRTGVVIAEQSVLMQGFNAVIRRLASELHVGLLDADKDLWSLMDWDFSKEKSLMRGGVHPNQVYCAIVGMKAMDIAYSRFAISSTGITGRLLDHTNLRPPSRRLRGDKGAVMNRLYRNHRDRQLQQLLSEVVGQNSVRLVAPTGSSANSSSEIIRNAFLYNPFTQTVHKGLSTRALRLMRLGPSDVREVPAAWLQAARRGPAFDVSHLFACTVVSSKLPDAYDAYSFSGAEVQQEEEAAADKTRNKEKKEFWMPYWMSDPWNMRLVRLDPDVANEFKHFFGEYSWTSSENSTLFKNIGHSCNHYSTESAQLLPIMAFESGISQFRESPYHQNMEGLLVRVDGQQDIYLLSNGTRRKVTWDAIDEMGKNHVRDVHILYNWMQMAIIPDITKHR